MPSWPNGIWLVGVLSAVCWDEPWSDRSTATAMPPAASAVTAAAATEPISSRCERGLATATGGGVQYGWPG